MSDKHVGHRSSSELVEEYVRNVVCSVQAAIEMHQSELGTIS